MCFLKTCLAAVKSTTGKSRKRDAGEEATASVPGRGHGGLFWDITLAMLRDGQV